jgi:hypothetical protein
VKKWYIVLAVFLLAVVFGIVLPVVKGAQVKTYYNEMAVHSAVHDTYKNTTGVTAEGTVKLIDANVRYFIKAVTKSGLVYVFFKPNTKDMPSVSVTFHNGAGVEVFDAGTTQKNKDLAYIVYTYNGKTLCFKLEGFETYDRAYACAVKEGFGGANIPVMQTDQAS